MDEIQKLQSLVTEHNVTIEISTFGCAWLSTLSFEDETMMHEFVSKNLKDLLSGMIGEIEKKYKQVKL